VKIGKIEKKTDKTEEKIGEIEEDADNINL